MKKLADRTFWWIELFAGLGFMTVGFFQDCSLTFGTAIISLALWPTLFLSAAVCVYRLLHFKTYSKSRGFWLIAALCVTYLLSTFLNRQYGWYENIRTLIMQGILFLMVYCYKESRSAEDIRKRRVWIGFYLSVCAVLTVMSFAYMLLGKNEIFYPETPEMPLYYTGFYWGRLYGVYWDPNVGALMCCVSLLLAIGIFSKNHNIILRIAMGCLVVLDVMYITFSDSRACRIALTVGVAVCAVLYTVKSRRRGVTVLLAVVAVVASVALPTAIKTVYNNSVAVMEKKETVSASSSAKPSAAAKPSAEPDATKVTIRPKETNAADISNRRIDIWKSAIEIFKEKPVFGVGHNTVLAYVEAEQEDSYLINNDHMHFSSMHNAFFDILVAQGAVGLLLYLALAVWCIIAVFKNWKQISMQLQGIAPAYLAVLAAMVCASCFMSEILYVCSPMSFMFWMALGALMQTVKKEEGEHYAKSAKHLSRSV